MKLELMPIEKKHVGLCDCHSRVIRNDSESLLKEILSHDVKCDKCGTSVKYKGCFTMQAENIIDEDFKEEKKEVTKKAKEKSGNTGSRGPITRENALERKTVDENGMPYCVEGKEPSYGALIFSIRFAVEDKNIELLNNIFYKYNDTIVKNVARYINKKEKAFLKENMNIEL